MYHVIAYSCIREFPHLQRSGALKKATSSLQCMTTCSTPMNMLLAINDSYVTIEKVSRAGVWCMCACGVSYLCV